LGDTLKHEGRIVREPETGVERRLTDENAPICPELAEFGKTSLDEGSTDATALPLRLD
jgi:hypothetical protein